MIELRSTKSFWKLPVAHLQWQDSLPNGSPGPCAKWHGYDRSVHFEFAGTPDQHGWLVGFGDLKPVRTFLEYYLDHTAIVPASDPRMDDILETSARGLVDLRVLPYGVSMEMTALFIWIQVNPFINKTTNGRCYISRVECREHDSNSAFFISTKDTAFKQAETSIEMMVQKPIWKEVKPHHIIQYINNL